MRHVIGLVSMAVVAGIAADSAVAQSLVDDFNDGSTSGWTTRFGSVFESGGAQSGNNLSFATYDGLTSSAIGVDAVPDSSLSYVALGLNYNTIEDFLFIKIQDNNANGLFDTIYFYHGNNRDLGLNGDSLFALSTEVGSTYFEARDNGDGTASAYVAATGETFGGTLSRSYSGTGVGLGYWSGGQADNFYNAAIPEPTSAAILIPGLACAITVRRRKR